MSASEQSIIVRDSKSMAKEQVYCRFCHTWEWLKPRPACGHVDFLTRREFKAAAKRYPNVEDFRREVWL